MSKIKNIQQVGNSKGVIIDQRILKELKNPRAFKIELLNNGVYLTPIPKNNKE